MGKDLNTYLIKDDSQISSKDMKRGSTPSEKMQIKPQ
jgi:hypothetical protein